MLGYTFGALIAFGIFLLEVSLLVAFAVLAASFPASDQRDANEDDAQRADVPLSQMVSSVVLYDRAYEVNRDRNAEMQGVENGLLAILAAVAAVAVLAIDELADLGFASLGCLALAFIACAAGYLRDECSRCGSGSPRTRAVSSTTSSSAPMKRTAKARRT